MVETFTLAPNTQTPNLHSSVPQQAFMWVVLDLEVSVTRALGNNQKHERPTTPAPKIIIRDLRVSPLKLNLTFDKVRLRLPLSDTSMI